MRFLLTNDDGIAGEGIQILAKHLSSEHEIWIIAPDSNRSASSHCITMDSPLSIRKIKDKVFSCSGMPVDCVINGLRAVLPFVPDAVISGINKGANIGTDILYSGTVAAARQAVLYGIPGIAFSIESFDGSWQYDAMASFASKNIENLIKLCENNIFVNVNALSSSAYSGCRLTSLSRRDYRDTIELYQGRNGHDFSFFVGGSIATESDPDGDFIAVSDGYISVSRVYAEPVAAEYTGFNNIEFNL